MPQSRPHEGLDQIDERVKVVEVGPVMPGEKDGRVKAMHLGLAEVIADILEMLPRWHRGEPGPRRLADPFLRPRSVAPDFMNVPVIRRRDDPPMLLCRPATNPMR